MNQTRLGSLIEAVFNTAIGFTISLVANPLIFPLFGFHITVGGNLMMGMIYTVISVARSYVIRRFFNAKLHAMAERAAAAINGGKSS